MVSGSYIYTRLYYSPRRLYYSHGILRRVRPASETLWLYEYTCAWWHHSIKYSHAMHADHTRRYSITASTCMHACSMQLLEANWIPVLYIDSCMQDIYNMPALHVHVHACACMQCTNMHVHAMEACMQLYITCTIAIYLTHGLIGPLLCWSVGVTTRPVLTAYPVLNIHPHTVAQAQWLSCLQGEEPAATCVMHAQEVILTILMKCCTCSIW